MGKGDQKTRRGKIFAGSYGRKRPKKKKKGVIAQVAKPAEKTTTKTKVPVKPKPKAEEKPKTDDKAESGDKVENKPEPKTDKKKE